MGLISEIQELEEALGRLPAFQATWRMQQLKSYSITLVERNHAVLVHLLDHFGSPEVDRSEFFSQLNAVQTDRIFRELLFRESNLSLVSARFRQVSGLHQAKFQISRRDYPQLRC